MPLITVNGLVVNFSTPDGVVEAVRGIDFDLGRGPDSGHRGRIRFRKEPDGSESDGAVG